MPESARSSTRRATAPSGPGAVRARRDDLSLDAAHVGIDPRSGSKGGLRWKGTRLRQSWSACQWMRAMTWPVTQG